MDDITMHLMTWIVRMEVGWKWHRIMSNGGLWY